MAFVHLHNRSQYSILDGGHETERDRRSGQGIDMESIALTDTCTGGAVEFYKVAKGAAAFTLSSVLSWWIWPKVSTSSMTEPRWRWNLIFLIESPQGYHNLCALVTVAIFDGMYFRPRIDRTTQAISRRFDCADRRDSWPARYEPPR